jgi:hypothetical protein
MAIEIPGQVVTVPASADLSALQFRFMTLDTAGKAAKPVGSTGPIYGVLQNKPNADGVAASIMVSGISKMRPTASTLGIGDLVASSTAGEPIPVAAGDFTVGRVVRGSSGSTGRIISVQIEPIGTT